MPTRRVFLKDSALAMFGAGAAPLWLARAAYAPKTNGRNGRILVAIFQRGAADGLNIVVPFGEPEYFKLRPSIAIPRPNGGGESAIDLDGFFGLHPTLSPLKSLYDRKQLAIINATGSPDPTRSHFDAQDYMESGTPGRKTTPDGWLNRALNDSKASAIRAVSLGPQLPRALRGRNPAVAINTIGGFQVRDRMASDGFEAMYSRSQDALLQGTGRDTFEAVRMLQSIAKEQKRTGSSGSYPKGRLGRSLDQIARLIKANVGLEVAFADLGGWDHHVNEAGANPSEGQLANQLREFGQALAAFHSDLGDRMENVIVVTMSEFGRTARENGSRGTDHGHGNVMFALGGPVKGGSIYGEWPGLAREQLYERRDLAVTTDFRDVLGEIVSKHLGRRELAEVFPGYYRPAQNFRDFVHSSSDKPAH
jgi:uncharacterized protein (DUF1501 family)